MDSGRGRGACGAGGGGGGSLESVVRDDEGVTGWGVLVEVAVGGHEVLCVASRWAAGFEPRVDGRHCGDSGLDVAVAEGRRTNP